MAKSGAGHGSSKCEPGCTCARHISRKHPPGCSCGNHAPNPVICPPGCQCGRHNRSGNWTGSTTERALHKRVARQRGRAATYLCVKHAEMGDTKPARDWARIRTETGLDIWADYVPLCRPCHLRYDAEDHWGPAIQAKRQQGTLSASQRAAWTPERRARQAEMTRRQHAEGRLGR